MKQYYPKKDDNQYYWQHAIADGPAYHYILPYHIWQLLSGSNGRYCVNCNSWRDSCNKYYKSYEDAIAALVNVLNLLKIHTEEYSHIKYEQ